MAATPLSTEATFTWDWIGTVPNRTEPDRLLFTWDHSGTGPEQIPDWTHRKKGPVLDPFQTGSKTVLCKQEAYPVPFSDWICEVPCKHIPNLWGLVADQRFVFVLDTFLSSMMDC